MKLLYILPAFLAALSAHAHFTLQYLWVNGVCLFAIFSVYLPLSLLCVQADEGINTALRIPPNNNPVTDVTSTDLTCNVGGTSGSSTSTVSIPAGATVRLSLPARVRLPAYDF